MGRRAGWFLCSRQFLDRLDNPLPSPAPVYVALLQQLIRALGRVQFCIIRPMLFDQQVGSSVDVEIRDQCCLGPSTRWGYGLRQLTPLIADVPNLSIDRP